MGSSTKFKNKWPRLLKKITKEICREAGSVTVTVSLFKIHKSLRITLPSPIFIWNLAVSPNQGRIRKYKKVKSVLSNQKYNKINRLFSK